MLGAMLAMLLFVALNARRIYWANQQMDESARLPAPALSGDVEMPRAEDVKVTGFVPRPQGGGRRVEQRRCHVEHDLLTGERFVSCGYVGKSRASRPICGGANGR